MDTRAVARSTMPPTATGTARPSKPATSKSIAIKPLKISSSWKLPLVPRAVSPMVKVGPLFSIRA